MNYAHALALSLLPGLVFAQAATEKVEGFKEATPVEQLVLLSIASTDKVLSHQEVMAAVAEVVEGEVDKGKTAQERLEIHGKLRLDAQAALKERNKARKAEKKRFIAFREPESYYQQALALDYLVAAGGENPTLEKLGCLKLIRETTSWAAHGNLVLAALSDAFGRDEEYAKADMKGKLGMIVSKAEERGLMSDQERTHLERPVLTQWLVAQLAAGKKVEELTAVLDELKASKLTCFFTHSWIGGILKRLAAFPNAAATDSAQPDSAQPDSAQPDSAQPGE